MSLIRLVETSETVAHHWGKYKLLNYLIKRISRSTDAGPNCLKACFLPPDQPAHDAHSE